MEARIASDIPVTQNVNAIDEEAEVLLFYVPLSLDLISALAGDRNLTESEKSMIYAMRQERDGMFFSDILYALTHRFFSPFSAEELWNTILKHKYEMSSSLNRNVRIAVAALDYLSNLTTELPSPTLSDEAYIANLLHLSIHDGLTGLFNHTTCFQRIAMELKRSQRYHTDVSLLMIDVDNFKEINDRFGHQVGDSVLISLAKILRDEARESDILCRYGGDEFTVIMPLTNSNDASMLAQRLREKISQELFDGKQITVSIGSASYSEIAQTAQELVRLADSALYKAKNLGKNQVVRNDHQSGINSILF